jgi:hypothetical protein
LSLQKDKKQGDKMSPWVVFEWAAAMSLSAAVVIGSIFGITIGVRYLISVSTIDWFKQ